MMLINEIMLIETFDNLFIDDTDRRQQLAPQVYEMLRNAYASQGGLKGSGFESPDAMVNKIPMWKVFRRGNEVKAVMMYKDKNGRKRVAMATDGSQDGKQAIINMLNAEYSQGRSYAEISGKSLAFHEKLLGKDGLDEITIPPSEVPNILGVDPSTIHPVDDHTYQREIGNEMITKRMIGNLGNSIT